ncbi:MAG TPA: tetratricopeptide repeat protein, partial [Thermoanaerobaculia bacterium]|nr:tetratricopeptide repeat protein [Thermoanaerobaculia bacterium]
QGAASVLLALLAVVAGLGAWRAAVPAWAGDEQAPAEASAAERPVFGDPFAPLTELGYRVTAGAAPGYVGDGACALCHDDLARSYAEVGMARSLYRPRAATAVEDFGSGYFHAPTRRHYSMRRDGDRYLFRRHQLDAAGEPINVFEREVDWIVGSGNHSRVYLYRTAGGELYQLPLSWYTQEGGRWGMAPGFEGADQPGVRRQVERACLFCHNAYPDVPAGSDGYLEPHRFPERLPEGIGCQRCHGPGAEHAVLALAERPVAEAVRRAIVNPGRLEPWLRDSVCYGCHMQPSIALPRVVRFGRGTYSFRPGEPLGDYLVPVDVRISGNPHDERFEINHHPYRLEQSACFQQSPAGALSCLSCHDPHRKVPPAERAAHYRAACLACHQVEALPTGELPAGVTHASPSLDCTSCHMPENRPSDVVEVTMTDHRIRVVPPGTDLTAPVEKVEGVVTDVAFLHPERAPAGITGNLYLMAAASRASGGTTAEVLNLLGDALFDRRTEVDAPDPWLDLTVGLARARRHDLLPRVLDRLAVHDPAGAVTAKWRAEASFAAGDAAAAVAAARRAAETRPTDAEVQYDLGRYLLALERPEEALAAFDEAVALLPNVPVVWFDRGRLLARLGRGDEAVASLRRALEIEPAFTAAYLELAELLAARGEVAEARRQLAHAVRVVADPAPVEAALVALPAGEQDDTRLIP